MARPQPTLEERIAHLETDVCWLKKLVKALDLKVWGILTAITLSIAIQLLIAVI